MSGTCFEQSSNTGASAPDEMAPAPRRSTGGRPAPKQPEKRSPTVLWLCYIGIPVALVFFLLGLGGVAVLLGAPPPRPTCKGHRPVFFLQLGTCDATS